MIEEQAVVVGVDGDKVLLEVVRSKPCGLCGQTRGCGISLWGRLLGHRTKVFRAENQINAQAGDMVVVGVDEKALLAGSLAVYGVPLFMLLAGAVVGGMFAPAQGSADGWTLAGAGSGLVLGLLWLRLHVAGSGLDGRYRTVLLRPAASDAHRPCYRGK